MRRPGFYTLEGVDSTLKTWRSGLSLLALATVLVSPACPQDEEEYQAFNEDDDCITVDVLEEGEQPSDDDDSADDDDDSATDDDDSATDDDDSATDDDDSADDDDDSATDDDDSADDDDDSADDNDDSAADDDSWAEFTWADITCCGGDTVIGRGGVKPGAAAVGETRYARVVIDRDAFEATGHDLDEVVRVTVSWDARGVGDGEAELEQDGLEDTLWDGQLGSGELGGVPRSDELCFHVWGEQETE